MEIDETSCGKKLWWEVLQYDESYDSDKEGSRPVKQIWPEDSLLTKDHFTIDEQQCLLCKKRLGYAMPMNKDANPLFLFCCHEDGSEKCRPKAMYLNCWACGNLHSEQTGYIVNRPGNCAYYPDPSQIYEFMCKGCHKEMLENEPGVEECREQMKKIRAARAADKQKSGDITTMGGYKQYGSSGSGGGGMQQQYDGKQSASNIYISQLSEAGGPLKKRKRSAKEEKEKVEEKEESDLMLE